MRNILLFFVFIIELPVFAQMGSIRGIVIDQSTKQPQVGATLFLENTSYRTFSDELGKFTFPNLADGIYTLRGSFIGSEVFSQQITLQHHKNQSVTVELKSGTLTLDEVSIAAQRPQNQQLINAIDIRLRPINNSQEVLRIVPGLFIGQHAGGGKAEQIFLRGFDIDHGTDIRLTVDGMPVNMVSHAHGQGYADLHFVIPELIERVNFKKGTYFADKGNFSTAGWVDFRTKDVLDRNMAKVEAGQFNTYRVFAAVNLLNKKSLEKGQSAYIGSEYNYSDSYFDSPQHFKRFNLIGKYNTRIGQKSIFNAAFSTLWSKWNHSGQIPDRAVASGMISHFGAIDDTEGGETSRSNANFQLTTQTNLGILKNQVFYSNYNFLLFSNFTFFKEDSINGDQIKQKENRNLFGYNGSYAIDGSVGTKVVTTTFGINYRHDLTQNTELSRTVNRSQLSKRLMFGNINEANVGVYWDEEIQLNNHLTANLGLRYDWFWNQYSDFLTGSKGKANAGIFSPKFNLFYTFNPNLQFYLNTGKSFHSNDTRVVVPQQAKEILPAAYGTDLGLNWKPLPRLFINAAAWYLWLAQEFVYVGDEGVVEPSGKTRRQGVDLTVRYQLTDKLFADVDVNVTKPRAIGEAEGENYLPLAPIFTSIGGLTYYARNGINGSLRYRYMGDRPANEDNSIIARGYFLTDLQVNYSKTKYNIGLSINNILNTKWKETQFATKSRLKNETEPVEEIHFTAGSPFFARLTFTWFW